MLMDHPPPMTEKNYRTISNICNQKIKVVAEKLMHEACEEIRGLSLDSEFVDTGIKHVNRYLRISPKMTCYLVAYMERLKTKMSLLMVRYGTVCQSNVS